MSDATGKATGKRILDDNGNWRTVTSLPQSVQDEIKKNNKIADQERMEKALAGNKAHLVKIEADKAKDLKSENEDLRAELDKIKADLADKPAPVKKKKVTKKKVTKKKVSKKPTVSDDKDNSEF